MPRSQHQAKNACRGKLFRVAKYWSYRGLCGMLLFPVLLFQNQTSNTLGKDTRTVLSQMFNIPV